MADALSIEQNNKIRIALGLKPLPVPGAEAPSGPIFRESRDADAEDEPGSTLESREAQGYQNWQQLQDAAEAKRRRQEKNAAIKRARDLAQRDAKLEGKGLGDVDVELDTKAWLTQHKKMTKKIEKERARKLAEELAERDRIAQYTSADLAGIKIAHDMDAFDDAVDGQILTLKDATIDENEEEGDELENLELVDQEKLKERLELKKKRTAYNPMEADGNTSILAQYDEEIDGKKRKHFTLDAKGSTQEEREAKRQHVSDQLNKQIFNLDSIVEAPVSDYMDISEVKIKKPKKKKAKATRQKAIDDDDDINPTPEIPATNNSDSMDLDAGQTTKNNTARPKAYDSSFVDDEDLQASLAIQRRAAFKKRKHLRPEELARQLREESSQTPMDVDAGDDAGEEPGLIIDETSEFVSNLQRPVASERPDRRVATTPHEEEEDDDEQEIKEELSDSKSPDVDMESATDAQEQDVSADRAAAENVKISGTGLDEETTLDEGLGSTLAMLRQRGLVQQTEAADLNSLHRDRQKFLQEKYKREAEAEKRARAQRERDRASGKLDRMSAREREEYARWENKQRDQQESRQMADIFNREYKPDVQLKYVDDHGRLMNQKEAFKHLSHQFHGKGSGKMKTEKHLKKIEEEKKREAMSALASSQQTGMNNAMGATAKKNRQAGVRLA